MVSHSRALRLFLVCTAAAVSAGWLATAPAFAAFDPGAETASSGGLPSPRPLYEDPSAIAGSAPLLLKPLYPDRVGVIPSPAEDPASPVQYRYIPPLPPAPAVVAQPPVAIPPAVIKPPTMVVQKPVPAPILPPAIVAEPPAVVAPTPAPTVIAEPPAMMAKKPAPEPAPMIIAKPPAVVAPTPLPTIVVAPPAAVAQTPAPASAPIVVAEPPAITPPQPVAAVAEVALPPSLPAPTPAFVVPSPVLASAPAVTTPTKAVSVAPAVVAPVQAVAAPSLVPPAQMASLNEDLAPATKRIISHIPSKLDTVKPKPTQKLSIDRVSPEVQDVLGAGAKEEAYESVGISIKVRRPGLDANYELNRAYTALMGGDTDAAISIYRDILGADPKNQDALFGLATTYHRLGNIDKARPLYGMLLALNPTHRDGLSNFLSMVGSEAPQEALAELERLEQRNPDFSPIPAQQAIVLSKLGYISEARTKMLRAIELAPDNLTYKYNLAVILDSSGHYADASALYRLLIKASAEGQQVPASLDALQKRLNFITTSASTRPSNVAAGG